MNENNAAVLSLAKRYDEFKSSLVKHSYINVTENTELTVENVKQILSYEKDLIRFRLAKCVLVIIGTGLKTDVYGGNESGVSFTVTVRGNINEILFS